MFNNLIESSSHIGEMKRRGSFFLFTAASYLVLFVIAGVASIYAYDARMEDPNTDSIVMLSPLELNSLPTQVRPDNPPPQGNNNNRNVAVREVRMASVNVPQVAPPTTSAVPNTNPPVPDRGPYVIGRGNSDPSVTSGPSGPTGGTGNLSSRDVTPSVDIGTPPPPAPIEKPKPTIVHKRVLNGEALSLPKPGYPPIARQARVQGTVVIQVLINESGEVVSAKVVSGNPMLVSAAQRAAYGARFSATILNDQPVKVSGVITYNFVLE